MEEPGPVTQLPEPTYSIVEGFYQCDGVQNVLRQVQPVQASLRVEYQVSPAASKCIPGGSEIEHTPMQGSQYAPSRVVDQVVVLHYPVAIIAQTNQVYLSIDMCK